MGWTSKKKKNTKGKPIHSFFSPCLRLHNSSGGLWLWNIMLFALEVVGLNIENHRDQSACLFSRRRPHCRILPKEEFQRTFWESSRCLLWNMPTHTVDNTVTLLWNGRLYTIEKHRKKVTSKSWMIKQSHFELLVRKKLHFFSESVVREWGCK